MYIYIYIYICMYIYTIQLNVPFYQQMSTNINLKTRHLRFSYRFSYATRSIKNDKKDKE